MDLSLNLRNTHVLITGALGAIGSVVVDAFVSAGCVVSAVDVREGPSSPSSPSASASVFYIQADVSSEASIGRAFSEARRHWGGRPVECCVALAGLDLNYLPRRESVVDVGVEEWRRVFRVNAEGAFLTGREWLKGVKEAVATAAKAGGEGEEGEGKGKVEGGGGGLKNLSLILVGSEAGAFGVRGSPEYSASKSAVQYGLLESLKGDVVRVARRARVNAVAPGPVDTPQFRRECAEDPDELWTSAQATAAQGSPVSIESLAKTMLFLASESWSGSVHGQVIHVNSGKMGKVEWKPGEFASHFGSV